MNLIGLGTALALGFVQRVFLLSVLYIAAPSIFVVVLAWALLRDCDFRLWAKSYSLDSPEKEETYFTDRVCWVTGASSGIGRSIALLLAERGAYVILSGRDKERLQAVADQCARAFLVQSVRLCYHSESGINSVLAEADDERNPRALILPFDLKDVRTFPQIVQRAVDWRGRVDALFNNAGIGERALLASATVDEEVFLANCLRHIHLIKAILPHALTPLPPLSAPSTTTPQFLRMTSRPVAPGETPTASVAGSLGAYVRSASLAGLQRTNEVMKRSRFGRLMNRIMWGTDLEYQRVFHIVNTSSIFAHVEFPGRAAYCAAKLAFGKFSEILEMEIRGDAHNRNQGPRLIPGRGDNQTGGRQSSEIHLNGNSNIRPGNHHTEVIVTNCLPGQIATPILKNVLLSDGEPADDVSDAMWTTGTPMTPERCAQLMIRAAVYQIRECWISKQPMLTYGYAAYYTPSLWKYIRRRFLELPSYKEMFCYNEERRRQVEGEGEEEEVKAHKD